MKGVPTVEALVARCLTMPEFLEAAIENPERAFQGIPDDVRRGARGLDFQKLWSFSGFIGKVQHNYLWEDFPATRKLLALNGIEHAVFGEYRRRQLSPLDVAPNRQARVLRFAAFFEDYLKRKSDSLTRTVFTHERILWELRSGSAAASEGPTASDAAGMTWREFQRTVPRLRANARVARFSHDPATAVAAVRRAGGKAGLRVRRKNITLLYRRDEAGEVRISRLDGVSALLLTAVGGKETARRIIAKIRLAGLEDVPPRAFRELFEEAARAGVLQMGG